jgi:hypothetical protein
MIMTRQPESAPFTFADCLKANGIPRGRTYRLIGSRPVLTPTISSPASKPTRPAPRKLTPAESSALAAKRRQLERELTELKRELFVKENALHLGSFSLAKIAASLKYPINSN